MTRTNDSQELLSTTQVAQRLGIARGTVLQRVDYGRLTPAGKLPGRTGAYLFNAEEIEALAEERDAAAKRTLPQKTSNDRSVA